MNITNATPGHSLLLWAAREDDPTTVRLVCAEAASQVLAGREEVVVAWRGCLASLPASLPFELLSLGVERVVLDRSGCASQWTTDWDGLAAVAAVADRLEVALVPAANGKHPRRILDADAMPVLRRRSLFGLGAVGDEPQPEAAFHGTPQQRLRAVVRRLASGSELPEQPADGWTSGAIDLAGVGCVACGVCVKTCPQDALALQTGGGRAGLGFDPSLCTGCGACVDACDYDALSDRGRLGPPALLASPVLLEIFEVRTCVRCRTSFRGVGEHCPVCAFRLANPFGSKMPPGWAPTG